MTAALPLTQLKQRAVRAFAWSALQSWSVKAFTLLVFLALARLLQPAELGLAQGVLLLLAFVAVLSAQGYPPALVQHPALQADDVNLPFFTSLATAALCSAALLAGAEPIAQRLGAPEAAALVRWAALIPPLAATSGVLMAMLRRRLEFGRIARVTLLATLAGGTTALALAAAGHGAGSLVAQALVIAALSAALLWRAPVWRPRWRLQRERFAGLFSYSSMAFAGQLLDFFAGRIIELVILARYGLAALGTYTVGAKLYLTILELLATALVEPALAALSRIAGDTERLRRAWLRLVFLAACTTLPLFAGVAALAPELCRLLFGPRWPGADEVTRWLCLLGALQAVQYFNSAALGATGRARMLLLINAAKLVLGISALALADAASPGAMTLAFVLGQMAVAPLSFGAALHATGASVRTLLRQLAPGGLAAAGAFGAVELLRTQVDPGVDAASRGLLLGTAYVVGYALLIGLTGGRRLQLELRDIATSWRR
ncbi:MAG: oligosaccharide flippase family protein [Piscinibacter sp.]|nr:oligosaccharide flippase family protein [Piscinibacter sp.]